MRVQGDHWAILLDYCEEHPEIITNKFNTIHGRSNSNNLWKELTNTLNSVGLGEKSQEEWKKTLIDWKSKTKAKAAKIQNYKRKTGGGEVLAITLNANEERLLNLMGKTAVEGNSCVPEIGIRKRKFDAKDLPELIPADIAIASTSTSGNGISSTQSKTTKPLPHTIPIPHKPLPKRFILSTYQNNQITIHPSRVSNKLDLPRVHKLISDSATPEEIQDVSTSIENQDTPASVENKNARMTQKNTEIPKRARKSNSDNIKMFEDMNNKLLDVLFEINGNLQDISDNFVKLVTVLENKSC